MNEELEVRLSHYLRALQKLKQQIKEYSNKKSMFKKFSLLKL